MKKIYCFPVLLLAVLADISLAADLPKTRPESVGFSSERLARMDAMLQAEVDAGNKAGITVLLARDGKVFYEKAFGYASLETAQPMATDSYFRMYSMTKIVTSVALLTLFEKGLFQLTDPLDKYIPGFANVQVYAGLDSDGEMILETPERKPTIQDVFRHTAGFTYGGSDSPVDQLYRQLGVGYGTSGSLREMVTEQLPRIPLAYHPGEQWVYSVSHDVQAYLVEYFSGMPFADYVQEAILDPLDMDDTFFGVPAEMVPRYTANYGANDKGELVLLEPQNGIKSVGDGSNYARYTEIPFGGSGLSSTAMDYGKFAVMLTNGGELDGVRILGPKTVELMRSNHLPEGTTRGNGSGGYGLGVSVSLNQAQAGMSGSEGEFGWAGAATTWVNMDPEENLVSILLTQFQPTDFDIYARWQNVLYQSLVEMKAE